MLRILVQLFNIHGDVFIKHFHIFWNGHIFPDFKIHLFSLEKSVRNLLLNQHIMSGRYILNHMRNCCGSPALKNLSLLFYLIPIGICLHADMTDLQQSSRNLVLRD